MTDALPVTPLEEPREGVSKLMADQKPSGAILYVVARFPQISETFVFNEWWQLTRRFRMKFASLGVTGERPMHLRAEGLLGQAYFLPFLHRSTLSANLRLLVRSPKLYAKTLRQVATPNARPATSAALKGAGVFFKAVGLAQLVRDLNVKHIHAHFANHPATAAWVVRRLTGVPFSFTAHANDLFLNPVLLERKVADADFVVAVSEYNRRYISDHVRDRARIHVIRCGVDPGLFDFHEPRAKCERILAVGRLDVEKGHDILLRAFAMVADDHPGLTLDILGSGPERDRLEALRDSLGLSRSARFYGAVTSEVVREFLAQADLFALASVRRPSGAMDGVPVAIMEAMSSGVPVAASDLSGIPELVLDRASGLLAPPGDVRGFAAAMRTLINDRELARSLALNARQQVEQRFNLEVEAQRLGALFEASIRRTPLSLEVSI